MAEPKVKLKKSNEKLVMPTPRPLNESIGPEYKPESPPRKPLGKINPSVLADLELRSEIEPGMVDPFAKLGYRLIELGDLDFLAFIAEPRYRYTIGGQYFPDKTDVIANFNQPFNIIERMQEQGVKLKKIPPHGIASIIVGKDEDKKGDTTIRSTHELAHAAFNYLRSKNLLPPNFKEFNQREEDFVTALDYLKRRDDSYNFATDEEILKDTGRIDPYLQKRAFSRITRDVAKPLFEAAESELRKLGVPPRAKRVEPPSPPPLRSEVLPKPPPTRSSQLNMIEKLFGRFLRKN